MKIRIIFIFFILLSSCTPSFSINSTNNEQNALQLNITWWENFGDYYLTDYVIKTTNDNYDVKINKLTTLIQKEYVKESLGRELPQLSLYPSLARDRFSNSDTKYLTTLILPVGVNYEADIWLKNRTATKIAKKEYEAIKYDEFAKLISLTSLTASTYIEISGLDKEIELQEELVKTRKKIAELMNINFQAGLCSSMDVTNVEQLSIEAENELETLKQTRNLALNMLSVLIGESSENSSEITRGLFDEINIPQNIPNEIKSEIIDKRPDILKAEAELQASALDVKLARKAFLPSINLSGFLGFNSTSFAKAFNWESFVINGTAGFLQPLFTGGQLRARLRAKKYNYDRMLAFYQQTILTSIQEINDGLVNVKSTDKLFTNSCKNVSLEEDKYNNNIMYKYQKGYLSYLDTLEYKEKLLLFQKDETQNKINYLLSIIGLYKSTAGNI